MGVDFGLYLITDRRLVKGPFYEVIEEALKGGVEALQLREKDLTAGELYAMACRLREITSRYGAKLFINDRVDVALAAGADGVHLAQAGLPLRAVRKVTGGKILAGLSTHTLREALDAEAAGADFITFGPVFETPSKRRYGPPRGLGELEDVAGRVSLPVFGLGGIKAGNVADLLRAGAAGVALISAILASRRPGEEAERFIAALRSSRRGDR